MGLGCFDPFREMDRLQSEMNRLFEGFQGLPDRTTSGGAALSQYSGRMWSPSVDIAETQNEIVLRAEIPGIPQSDIDIELTGDTLTLRGERKRENEERKDQFVCVESSYGRFQRSFTIGVPVDNDRVTASYRDGVLEVRLPKSEAAKPRKIQVTTGESSSSAIAANGSASAAQRSYSGESAQSK
jgi:HSP20 family protein